MQPSDAIVNEHELRVFGLQRSGIHAIVNWIIQQAEGNTLFVNDIKSLTGNLYHDTDDYHWNCAGGHEEFDVSRERDGTHSRKTRLILGYEDTDLRHLPAGFSDLLQEAVGKSGIVRNVLIVRDPFNLFASRFAFHTGANRNPMPTRGEHVRGLWKQHALECLGRTRYLGDGLVIVRYNDWFVSPDYRRTIADALDLTFTDRGLETVPGVTLPPSEFARFGCGSSFDRQKFHGRAQEMDVLGRWRRFARNPRYRSLFSDREVISLSNEIFGRIEGTSKLTCA